MGLEKVFVPLSQPEGRCLSRRLHYNTKPQGNGIFTFRHKCVPQALMFGNTLAARVPHCWRLSSVPHPPDRSFCTFNARVLGTRLWAYSSQVMLVGGSMGCSSPVAEIC